MDSSGVKERENLSYKCTAESRVVPPLLPLMTTKRCVCFGSLTTEWPKRGEGKSGPGIQDEAWLRLRKRVFLAKLDCEVN